jgi:hypothetical protein
MEDQDMSLFAVFLVVAAITSLIVDNAILGWLAVFGLAVIYILVPAVTWVFSLPPPIPGIVMIIGLGSPFLANGLTKLRHRARRNGLPPQ